MGFFDDLKAARKLAEAVRELAERVERVERSMKTVDGEWSDVLDRVNRMMGRVAKRSKVDEREAAPPPEDTYDRQLRLRRGEAKSDPHLNGA